MIRVLAVLFFAATAMGQTLPTSWVGAGAAYTTGGHPPVSGLVTYAQLVSQASQTYSYSSYSSVLINHTVMSTVMTGLAPLVRHYGPLYILCFGTAGIAQTPEALTSAFSGGGMGVLTIGKTHWTVDMGVQVLKSQSPMPGTSNTQTMIFVHVGRSQ